jgi:hypothetical protein
MLRKTLMTLTAVAALSVGSAAMAAGGGHGGRGGGGHGGGGWSGGARAGVAAMPGGGAGPMMMRGSVGQVTRGGPMTTAPINGGRVQGWSGRTAWSHDHFHDRFHRHRRFLAFGFGGYDYGYDTCWAYNGWRWVYVCGGYGYY